MEASTKAIVGIIEDAGFGRYQLCAFALSYGVWFCDGIELAFVAVLTPNISEELGISNSQRAFVVSLVFQGLMLGCFIGGYLGDTAGRRPPILLSYVSIALCTVACTCVTKFNNLAVIRFLLGISMGIGMPPSLALVNETTPKAWTTVLFGLRAILFAFGYLYAISFVLVDDPTLDDIHWRIALTFGAVPPFLLGVAAYFGLTESPRLLATQGRHCEVIGVLRTLLRQNRCSETLQAQVDALDAAHSNYDKHVATVGTVLTEASQEEPFKIIFGQDYRYTTFMLAFCCSTSFLVEYGTAYAEPFVLKATHADVPPGWQLFTKYLISVVWRIFATVVAYYLTRRTCLCLAFVVGVVSLVTFAWVGSVEERGQVYGLLYYTSQYSQLLAIAINAIVLKHLSVDSYPTFAAATGGAVCIGFGRLGAIAAPFFFEWLPGDWTGFYYLAALMCAISCVLVLAHPDLDNCNERLPLLRK